MSEGPTTTAEPPYPQIGEVWRLTDEREDGVVIVRDVMVTGLAWYGGAVTTLAAIYGGGLSPDGFGWADWKRLLPKHVPGPT